MVENNKYYKKKFWLLLLVLFSFFFFLGVGVAEAQPEVNTPAPDGITSSSAYLYAELTSLGGYSSVDLGVRLRYYTGSAWSSWENILITWNVDVDYFHTWDEITDLNPGSYYQVQAWARPSGTSTYYYSSTTRTFETDMSYPLPTVTTDAAGGIGDSSAYFWWRVTNWNGYNYGVAYVEYKKSTSSTWTSVYKGIYEGGQEWHQFTSLDPGTTYDYRIKLNVGSDTAYSSSRSFTTTQTIQPSLSTLSADQISYTSARLRGSVSTWGTVTSDVYFDWWGASSGWVYMGEYDSGDSTGTIYAPRSGLVECASYTYEMSAETSTGQTIYGGDRSFSTLCRNVLVTSLPAQDITQTSFIMEGRLDDRDGLSCVHLGFERRAGTTGTWQQGSQSNDVCSNNFVTSDSWSSLTPGSTYQYRVYAEHTSTGQRWYGDVVTVTLPDVVPPNLTALEPTGLTPTSFWMEGVIVEEPDETRCVDLGFETRVGTAGDWAMAYQTSDVCAGGLAGFWINDQWTGLTPDSTYQYRVFATDDVTAETWYSDARTVNTPALTAPTVSSEPVEDLAHDSFTMNGLLVNRGDYSCLDIGFERRQGTTGTWQQGDIAYDVCSDNFFLWDTWTGLTPETIYQYRFYAEDTTYGGEWYGDTITVTTTSTPPVIVSTLAAIDINISEATLQGELNDLGVAPSADLYFDYRIKNSSSWTEKFVIAGVSDLGLLQTPISGLDSDTVYEFRFKAFANSQFYNGSVLEFSTLFEEILGCTDPEADNYNETANTDDGSCFYTILGCTDPEAVNYDPEANTDDGSCEPVVLGCTDPEAVNYDPEANTDDGSCEMPPSGCTDDRADNYDPVAVIDDGSCTYENVIPPEAQDVIINPSSGFTNTSFTCSWTYHDPQGYAENDTVVKWYADDLIVEQETFSAGNSDPVLSSSLVNKNEEIRCAVEPSNGLSLGSQVYSSGVIIQNTLPTFSDAQLSPSSPTKNSLLLCNAVNPDDVDGDSVTVVARFFKSGNIMIQDWGSPALSCVANDDCVKGETIWCEAKVFDGDNNSTNSEISNQVIIQNSRPVVDTVSILPNRAIVLPGEDLTCNYTYTDLDEDVLTSVSFKWYKWVVVSPSEGYWDLTTNINQVLSSTQTAEEDIWKCGVLINDGSVWSAQKNSTMRPINKDAPVITSINVPDNIAENDTKTVSWNWLKSEATGDFKHYICESNNITSSGCLPGEQVCSITDDILTTSCEVEFAEDLSKNLYLAIYDSNNEGSQIEQLSWGFVFDIPGASAQLSVQAFSNYNRFVCEPINLPSGFDASLLYEFSVPGTIIQEESSNNVFFAMSGPGTSTGPVTCSIRALSEGTYSSPLIANDHVHVSEVNIPSMVVKDSLATISVDLANFDSVNNVTLAIRSPLMQVFSDIPMTEESSGVWEYSFSPNTVGSWLVYSVLVNDGSSSYLFKGTTDKNVFSVTAPTEGGEGGGGGDVIEVIELPKSGNVSGFCGDGICQEWEDPFNCWQDCKINIDTLFTCIWDDEIDCNWNQSWFAAGLLIFLVGIIGVSIVYYELRKRK